MKAELSGVPACHCEIAHAEVNALLALDNRIHTKAIASTYTIYVSLENLSIFLNVYCNLLRGGSVPDVVHDEFAKDAPDAVARARALAPGDVLGFSRLDSFADVYPRILAAL